MRSGTAWSDPRLQLLTEDMFRGKRCLDIGCNAGYLTLTLANKYEPEHILGIDIDPSLISKARRSAKVLAKAVDRLRAAGNDEYRARNTTKKRKTCAPDETSNEYQREPTDSLSESETTSKKRKLCLTDGTIVCKKTAAVGSARETQSIGLSDRVHFRRENFIRTSTCEANTYDVILCLSVTKWVHLNWGDDGLKKMFRKIHGALKIGGRLILEPQPWRSYRKKYNLTERTKRNFHAIEMRPDSFPAFLLREIGFRSMRLLGKPKKATRGFGRSIYEYVK